MKTLFVFYIEDSETDITHVRAALANTEVELTTAGFDDAWEKLTALSQRHPDLILLDLANDRTGSTVQATDIIARLAKSDSLKRVPVLCYSNKYISPADFPNKDLPYAPLGDCYKTSKSYSGAVLIKIIRDILANSNSASPKP